MADRRRGRRRDVATATGRGDQAPWCRHNSSTSMDTSCHASRLLRLRPPLASSAVTSDLSHGASSRSPRSHSIHHHMRGQASMATWLSLVTPFAAGYQVGPEAFARPSAASSVRCAAAPMMSTEVQFGDASRKSLMAGIDAVANAVKVTLGPKGRNVVLERSYGVPEIVNDGVTIARDIELEDPRQNTGAKLLVEVASKTDQRAGDGTTTSTLLTQALVSEGLRLVASGAPPRAPPARFFARPRRAIKISGPPSHIHAMFARACRRCQPDGAAARPAEGVEDARGRGEAGREARRQRRRHPQHCDHRHRLRVDGSHHRVMLQARRPKRRDDGRGRPDADGRDRLHRGHGD